MGGCVLDLAETRVLLLREVVGDLGSIIMGAPIINCYWMGIYFSITIHHVGLL